MTIHDGPWVREPDEPYRAPRFEFTFTGDGDPVAWRRIGETEWRHSAFPADVLAWLEREYGTLPQALTEPTARDEHMAAARAHVDSLRRALGYPPREVR